MENEKYYTSGQFARMANISIRTVRYYDQKNLLKPSKIVENSTRLYTENDFMLLQQILLFKYLGFSLDEIRELTMEEKDLRYMKNSLILQQKLIQDKIEQLQMVEYAIGETVKGMEEHAQMDWSKIMELIHLTNMEKSLKAQYRNSSNISARIQLHCMYSSNKTSWFEWLYDNIPIKKNQRILEIGCGNGQLWLENKNRIPEGCQIALSDISEGMIRELNRNEELPNSLFTFQSFDAEQIPYEVDSFDLLIANHMLFYCEHLETVLKEIKRVLKPGGYLVASTYGKHHMQEIGQLVKEFDSRIVLAAENLYERFGKENGKNILENDFSQIQWVDYEDYLLVDSAEPLIEYILSCHGNQNQYILEKYTGFKQHVTNKVKKALHITKEAGFFCAKVTK